MVFNNPLPKDQGVIVSMKTNHRREEGFTDNDIVKIEHDRYTSRIISDPDGHSIELYVDKPK
jgi:hypothetical protein